MVRLSSRFTQAGNNVVYANPTHLPIPPPHSTFSPSLDDFSGLPTTFLLTFSDTFISIILTALSVERSEKHKFFKLPVLFYFCFRLSLPLHSINSHVPITTHTHMHIYIYTSKTHMNIQIYTHVDS